MKDSEKAIADFLAKGGKVKKIDEGKTSQDFNPYIGCKCGCHGNYTDHTMRLGERGIR